jgi:hypothetical protein
VQNKMCLANNTKCFQVARLPEALDTAGFCDNQSPR